MTGLEAALVEAASALESLAVPYMLMGGLERAATELVGAKPGE